MYVVPAAWISHVVSVRGPDAPDVRAGLAAAGLPDRLLQDPAAATARVTAQQFATFIETAARIAADAFYGLELGLRYDLRASGLAGYLSLACGTARESLTNACRYGAISDTSSDYALTEAGDGAFFRIETRSLPLRMSRHATEFKVAIIISACLTWVGQSLCPREARFAHPRADPRPAEWRLGCPAQFGAEATGLVFHRDQLSLRPRTSDPHLLDLLERVALECLSKRGSAAESMRSRVERMLVDCLARGVPTVREVAEELGLSERTLARRLTTEGTSFGQLLDDLRHDMARAYLEDLSMPLSQVAYLLGYADQSAFSNAFRRWTGRSPGRFRADAASASP